VQRSALPLKALSRIISPEQLSNPSPTARSAGENAEENKDSLPASLPFPPPRNASIVIPNWNGRELLEKYLPSVVEACTAEDEVIVVDNASTDGSGAAERLTTSEHIQSPSS